jgi:hypothetical protein
MSAFDQTPPCGRVFYGAIALLVIVLLTCGIGVIGLISDTSDFNFNSQDSAVLAEEDSSEASESAAKFSSGKKLLAGIDLATFAECTIAIAPMIRTGGQIAFAIPNGGIPRSSHPTGPPPGHV